MGFLVYLSYIVTWKLFKHLKNLQKNPTRNGTYGQGSLMPVHFLWRHMRKDTILILVFGHHGLNKAYIKSKQAEKDESWSRLQF